MLSEIEKTVNPTPIHAAAKNDWPPIEPYAPVRIKYCKRGDAQYFSHLDLQRTVQSVLNRAGIPVWYTLGFNPHPKVVFALPLSIGVESACEYLDLRIDRDMPLPVIMEKLNAELTDDMRILEVYTPVTSFTDMASSDYTVELCWDGMTQEKTASLVKMLGTSPVNIVKKGKAGERTVDIVPMIQSVSAAFADGVVKMVLRLSATQDEYLNPESLVGAARTLLGLGVENPLSEYHTVFRTQVYDANGNIFH